MIKIEFEMQPGRIDYERAIRYKYLTTKTFIIYLIVILLLGLVIETCLLKCENSHYKSYLEIAGGLIIFAFICPFVLFIGSAKKIFKNSTTAQHNHKLYGTQDFI